MEAFFAIILVLVVVATVMGTSIVGLGIWSITRLISAIADRIAGKHKNPARIVSADKPKIPGATHTGQSRSATAVEAAPQVTYEPPAPKVSRTDCERSRRKVHHSYRHQDPDGGATPQSIAEAVRPYENEPVVCVYAEQVMQSLERAERYGERLRQQIDLEFSQGSISWERFAGTAERALDALVRNCALLANRVQTFDVEEYQKMERYYRAGGEVSSVRVDPARIERWQLILATKQEMDRLNAANEGLLLSLEKLCKELSKLSDASVTSETAHIVQDVDRLAEETKLYR